MSRAVRKQLLQTIELLQQGTQEAKKLIETERTEESLGLLEDCQQLAIALGTRIEKLYGEGTSTVSELEAYCESAYQVGAFLQQREDISVACQEMLQHCVKVQDVLEREFPDKLEVVFLPYKASMWDSLESVWMEARDDANCETYVMPIPYYTLDRQQKFKDFCYEGGQYPDYVPITDYREYDLKLHHPDIIFVHNPYDEFNTVTSIAPEYYLKTIKDYTDKLVYIPYFVLKEIAPNDQMEIEHMKHFCFLPGTMYADKVILQSEDMRDIYIKEYRKACEERGIQVNEKALEQKFLGLGSPKFDKVLHTRREEQNIPADWRQVIEKPDGSWKKIIFYNTGISALLEYGEKMLTKMQDVFRIFYENRNEVALLWRPHPLIKDTIQSMRPDLWKVYQQIVRKYREEGWGIYDDSADMDRAVVLSDAYYGDVSSVVQVYQKTGKPVMVQNPEIIENTNEI